jgi:hypothetical protein
MIKLKKKKTSPSFGRHIIFFLNYGQEDFLKTEYLTYCFSEINYKIKLMGKISKKLRKNTDKFYFE